MAIIYSYPQIGELATGDTIAISDASNGNKTKSVTIGQLDSYINTGQATIVQVDDSVVTGASFNTSNGLLTLTRNGGEIPSVTTNLDGRYYLSSNPNSYTSNLGVVQSLTTTGTSGAATLIGGVLNIPQYSGGGGGTITQIDTTTPITGGTITTTGTIGITQATTNTDGYLSSGDWNTFNNKSSFDGQYSSLTGAPTIPTNNNQLTNGAGYTTNLGIVQSLTTTGSSGAATLVGGTLNIPQYSGGGGGGITEITTTAPITGGTITDTGTIGITQASGSANGYLSSTDWNTFNNKSTFDGQFSSLSNTPTTISGYGITDALQLGVTSNTALAGNTTTITTAQENEIAANTLKVTFPEAPSDGSQYARQNGGWSVVSGSGGGVTSIIAGTGIGVDQSTGDVTITNTGGVGGGAWTAVTRTFNGSELVDAFNGNVGEEIVLVTVPSGYQGLIQGEVVAYVDYSTGTTDYSGTNLDLKIDALTAVNQAVTIPGTIFTNSNFPFTYQNGQTDGGSIISDSFLGDNIVLTTNNTQFRANFTAGDRDFTISFTYRLVNLNL